MSSLLKRLVPKSSRILSRPRTSVLQGAFASVLLGALAPALWAGPNLSLGNASGNPGDTVSLSVQFDPNGSSVAGGQFNIILPAGWSTGTVTAGAAATSANKIVSANLVGGAWTFIIFGINQDTIGAGNLMTINVKIPLGAAAGTRSLAVTGADYADPAGIAIAPGTTTGGVVTVAGADTTSPLINVTAPAGGSTVNGTVNIAAAASDNVGVDRVQFFVDGIILSTDTTSPYSASWGSLSVSNGTHNITAKAFDAAGNSALSSIVSVTVNNPTPPNCVRHAPSLSVSSSAQAVAGTPVVYTLNVTNNDNTACAPSIFALDGTSPTGWTSSFSPTFVNLTPGGRGTASFTLLSPDSAAPGNYSATLRATHGGDAAIIVSTSIAHTLTVPVNLVENGGFEDFAGSPRTAPSASGWAFSPLGSVDKSNFRSGAASAKIMRRSEGISSIALLNPIPVSPNAAYTFRAFLKTLDLTSTGEARAVVQWLDGNNNLIAAYRIGNSMTGTSGVWGEQKITLMSPPQAAFVKIKLQTYNAKGSVWFDDVTVHQGGSPVFSGLALILDAPDTSDPEWTFGDVYAYPNPAVSQTAVKIHVEIGAPDNASLRIYDESGRKIMETPLENPSQKTTDMWTYEYSWDVRDIAAGIYVFAAEARTGGLKILRKTGKIALIK